MNTEKPIYSKLQLLQYPNPGGKVLATDPDGKIILVDAGSGPFEAVFLTSENDPQFVGKDGGGIISINDWQADFSSLISGNMVGALIWVKIGGVWLDRSGIFPQMTFNEDDTLLQTITWLLAETQTIQKIKVRLK